MRSKENWRKQAARSRIRLPCSQRQDFPPGQLGLFQVRADFDRGFGILGVKTHLHNSSGLGAFAALLIVALIVFSSASNAKAESAHDFAFTSIEGESLPMSSFAGQSVLLVNTASFCAFTPQYEALQSLWEAYRGRGFVVLGVPSDNFGGQEYDTAAEVKTFCEVNYDIDFPMTEKQMVKGEDAHPLYRWIASSLGREGVPRWNFHKFLIDPDGRVVASWPSGVKPTDRRITAAIEASLPR